MKAIIKYVVFMLLWTSTFTSWSQTTLQCPPCRPVVACDQCWESVEQAEENGCFEAGNEGVNQSAVGQSTSEENRSEMENTSINFHIYPNPSLNGYFTVEIPEDFNGIIQVSDQSGRKVLEYGVKGETMFNSSDPLESGLYFVILKSQEGLETKRLIIIK
ncbi:T9SS type A sorting domain-containing protein [Xanthovirga aplysinae]|uniref:T9SS type A sorting domain-containing protein n=1 Tax=Xanthovirga aplysinae TaxID=2529853 RepID=UPI0012BBEBCF|nr:T9SS type A sorting domain-containing protein [Xanthovirga aplysinae]MTI33105.1 T9SS type A sorting domain-containing protein [Xanthovirga aplysinae]